jgi:hypothetical protein
MTLTYASKFKIVTYAIPVVVVGFFAVAGSRATRALFAQTPSTNGINISLPKTQYHVGETVVATVSNASNASVYVVNNCPDAPLVVSRRIGSVWTVVAGKAADGSKCVGEPRDYKIPANQSVPISYKYWPSLFAQPGTYRIKAPIEPTQQGPVVKLTVVD